MQLWLDRTRSLTTCSGHLRKILKNKKGIGLHNDTSGHLGATKNLLGPGICENGHVDDSECVVMRRKMGDCVPS